MQEEVRKVNPGGEVEAEEWRSVMFEEGGGYVNAWPQSTGTPLHGPSPCSHVFFSPPGQPVDPSLVGLASLVVHHHHEQSHAYVNPDSAISASNLQ